MYENEIYSGDRTGDHTTGTHQNYQMNTGNIPREPEKRNIPAVLEKAAALRMPGTLFWIVQRPGAVRGTTGNRP